MEPKFFTLEELCFSEQACENNIINVPSFHVVRNLELLAHKLDMVRKAYGMPIKVTSGFRCKELNELVGGSSTSYHMCGLAADITSCNLAALYRLVKQFPWTECYCNTERHYIHLAY